MGASSAQAMTQGRQQEQLQEQIEAQFLTAAAVLRQARPAPDGSCDVAAEQLHSQLVTALPPVPGGLVRELSLGPASATANPHVQVTLTSPGGLRRQRWYSPAAAGLCAPGTPSSQGGTDAAL